MNKLIGPDDSIRRFFNATQYFQNTIGACWLIDSSRKVTDSCYEITLSENVRHCEAIVKSIAIASGCYIERNGLK